ncbi:hypothetical protein L596_021958 [Steinernema carpocapsae]|uniref:Uncharacterized protein n=1 Tax=Steinernema carpocapsae TaxID=34508 RepID=A0A4U5ML54_STECR|nr:hypothetical protein L596_021958 [Steinernema carpocapsae]
MLRIRSNTSADISWLSRLSGSQKGVDLGMDADWHVFVVVFGRFVGELRQEAGVAGPEETNIWNVVQDHSEAFQT